MGLNKQPILQAIPTKIDTDNIKIIPTKINTDNIKRSATKDKDKSPKNFIKRNISNLKSAKMEIENLNERMRLSKSQSKDAIAKKSRHLTPEFKEKRNKD